MSIKPTHYPLNLILCDWNQPGDIPCIDIEFAGEIRELVAHWIKGKKGGRVYVCFDSWRNVEYANEYPTILITNFRGEVIEYAEQCVRYFELGKFDFNIFEFEDWKEALIYCRDLKQGL